MTDSITPENPAQDCSPLLPPRQSTVAYHLGLSRYWALRAKELGPTAMVYGALEMRLAMESVLVHLLLRIRGEELDESDLKALRKAKAIQQRIRELEGHQQQLNRKLKFLTVLLQSAGVTRLPVARVDVPTAFRLWGELSEMCHFVAEWTDEVQDAARAILKEAERFLALIAETMIVWPKYHDADTRELERRYVAGEITTEDVRSALEETGVWARVVFPDGSSRFAADIWGDHEPETPQR